MNAEQLFASAQEHAQEAFRAKTSGRVSATALHLGVMLELLAKTYLFRLNPAYIVADRSFDSLRRVGGHAKNLNPDLKIRTIGAKEALKRFAQMNPQFKMTQALELVIDARDGAVHAGDRPEDVDQVLLAALQAAKELLDELGHDAKAFWDSYADSVTAILAEHIDRVHATVRLRIDRAASDYKEHFGGLEAHQLMLLAAVVEAGFTTSAEESTRENCPACGNSGLLTGRNGKRWALESDYEDGIEKPYIVEGSGQFVLYPSQFRCPHCSLKLDEDELDVVGLGPTRVLYDLTD